MSEKIKPLDPKELAEYMHLRYEQYAQLSGWKTNEKTRVPFDELPEENKVTMLALATDILVTFSQRIQDAFVEDMAKLLTKYKRTLEDLNQ